MSHDYKNLLSIQNDLFGKISRASDNLKKSGASKITLGAVESRLQALEERWKRFESYHERLLAISSDEKVTLDYFKQDFASMTEEAFLTQRGLFLDLIRSLKTPVTAAIPEASAPAVHTTQNTLPQIQLPQFSGKYEDWPAFRDLFQAIVSRETSISAVEKLHYLKTSLKGEAELFIRNFSTTGENFERAWNTLSSYYENKRLLVRAYLGRFVSLPKLKTESVSELRKILHCLKSTVDSLEGIDRPITNSEDLFVYLAVELLDPRSRREWESSMSKTSDPPSFLELVQFIHRRLRTLESMLPIKVDNPANKSETGAAKTSRSHFARKQDYKSNSSQGRCSLCQRDHFIIFCEAYREKTAQERRKLVEEKKLCVNCLGRHKLEECNSKKQCSACNARHHTSIHDACRALEIAETSHVSLNPCARPVPVLLATARVRVTDRHGLWHLARALVDQGSESSMISERLAQKLRLPREPASVSVYGIGGQKASVARGRINLTLASRFGGPPVSTSALVLPRLTAYACCIDAGARTWPHLQDLELADPEFGAPDVIDILLGAEVYASVLEHGLRKGGALEPVAQNTSLGWILSGPIGEASNTHLAYSHQCQVEDDLSAMVRRLWMQEEIPSPAVAYSLDDRK